MLRRRRSSASLAESESAEDRVVHPLPFSGDDAAFVHAIVNGHPGAVAQFYALYAEHVRRVLLRILGFDSELADILHDAFVRALESIGTLRDPAALKPWLTSVAVFTAKTWIQRRHRQRWLRFFSTQELPEVEAPRACGEAREALQAAYKVLVDLPVDERIALCLRLIEGMEVREIAATCRVPLSTMKRRLAQAEVRFRRRACRHPVLNEWLAEGETP